MDSGQQSSAPGTCPGCGQSLDAHAIYCPNCGRPNQALAGSESAQPLTTTPEMFATAPVQSAYSETPPPLPSWAEQPTTVGGIAALGAGPAVSPEQPVRSHKRRNILTAISAVVVVALLGSGAYWAYAAFASRTDNQLARYYPSNTVAFASADLVAASSNNFSINPTNLEQTQSDTLQNLTGLDWKNDVLSWVGRDISVGVFPLASGQAAITNPSAAIGVVALAQSRDDNAAKAAIAKFNTHMSQKGTTFKQVSYKGFVLYTSPTESTAGTFGSGSGWVIIASTADAAHAVIDRIANGGDSLNDQQSFKDATSNLPNNRFGTYYLNLRQMLTALTPVQSPNGLGSISVPFIQTYPVAGGYVGWTNSGERSQITFNAVRNPNIPDVSGDTNSFASLVPSDAVAYSGVANLGRLIQATMSQVGTAGAGADPLMGGLGISATDPLAQQPAGVAVVKNASGTPAPVFYVHVADDASATQLINRLASARNWTAKPTTVAGQAATALYEPDYGYGPPPAPGGATNTVTARLAAVAITLNNTLVIAPDTTTATLISQVAQGSAPNLTSNATFEKMVKGEPTGAAASGYVSASAIRSMIPASPAITTSALSKLDVLAFTLVWNNSVLQATFDATPHS